jgi:hypothetical protein
MYERLERRRFARGIVDRARGGAPRGVPRRRCSRARAQQLHDSAEPLDELIQQHLPAVACGPGGGIAQPVLLAPRSVRSGRVGLARISRSSIATAQGQPYRFLDMGALIATQAFGENDPVVVRAVLESLPFVTSRYAHSSTRRTLSLRLKAELRSHCSRRDDRVTFIVNTGAEAVENAIKARCSTAC